MTVAAVWKDRARRTGHAALMAGAVLGAMAACQTFITPDRPNIAGIAAGLDGKTAQVCAFGTQFVTAYLEATTADRLTLNGYITLPPTAKLPKTSALVIDSASCYTAAPKITVGDSQIWSVFVATLQRSYPGALAERGFYQVPVSLTRDQPRAVDAPAARSQPGSGIDVKTGYPISIDAASPLYSLASGFVAAYLTGTPALDRYITGDSGLAAVGGYPSAIVTAVETAEQLPDQPANNTVGHLLVHVAARTVSPDVFVTYTYPLTLKATDATWMIAAIDTAPRINRTQPAPAGKEDTP